MSMDVKGQPENKVRLLFVSAEPTTIAIKGSGGGTGLQENAIVTYQVLDSDGTGVANVEVAFVLTTNLGGVKLNTGTDVTDAQGIVRVVVESGTLPTPVRVQATLGGVEPLVLSDTLNVSRWCARSQSVQHLSITHNPLYGAH